ncbi:polysaccharide biosynthesis C-terminal domain-containing protein [Pseudarthrobacter sp. AG30]|uniref:polysaccharide biosynthesis C-terminal domain-containing protein n=1 Tax=Pseudarthrobacter sp. AG30 TaxID=2249742 RepID=UPI0010582450
MGPEIFGPLVAAVGLGATLAGLIDFGSNSLSVREMAAKRMDLGGFGSRLSGKLLIGTAGLTLWAVTFFVFARDSFLWVAGPIAFSQLLGQSFVVPLRARGRTDLLAAATLIDRLTVACCFLVLHLMDFGPQHMLWVAMAAGPVVSASVTRWILARDQKPDLSWSVSVNPWRNAKHYGVSSAAVSAQSLDLTIMSLVGGASVAGVYGAVNRWTQPMSLLAAAFTTSTAPLVAKMGSWRTAWPLLKRSSMLIGGAVLLCVGVAVFSEPLVAVLVGSDFADSAAVLRILAVGTIGAVLNQPVAAFLQALGNERAVSFITTSGVGIQLMLVALLTWAMGSIGAALAFAVLQTIILTLLLVTIVVSRRRSLIVIGRHSRGVRGR